MNFRLSRCGFRYLFQEEFQDMISIQAAKATEPPLGRAEQRWPERGSEWARVTQQDAEATVGTGGRGVFPAQADGKMRKPLKMLSASEPW